MCAPAPLLKRYLLPESCIFYIAFGAAFVLCLMLNISWAMPLATMCCVLLISYHTIGAVTAMAGLRRASFPVSPSSPNPAVDTDTTSLCSTEPDTDLAPTRTQALDRSDLVFDEDVRQRHQYLSDAAHHMADGIAIFDQHGYLVFVNKQYPSFFYQDRRHSGPWRSLF